MIIYKVLLIIFLYLNLNVNCLSLEKHNEIEKKYYTVSTDDRVCKLNSICGGYFLREINVKTRQVLKSTIYVNKVIQKNNGTSSSLIEENQFKNQPNDYIIFYGRLLNANNVTSSIIEVDSIFKFLNINNTLINDTQINNKNHIYNITSIDEYKFYKFDFNNGGNSDNNVNNIIFNSKELLLKLLKLNTNIVLDKFKFKLDKNFEKIFQDKQYLNHLYWIDYKIKSGNSIFINNNNNELNDLFSILNIDFLFLTLPDPLFNTIKI